MGKYTSAPRAGGPTPYKGWVPPARWVSADAASAGPPARWADLAMLRPHSPTMREGPTPCKGWAHLQGGQRSVSLEYQTCTSAYLFDTLVAGKDAGAGVLREGKSVRTIHLIDILNRTGACVMTERELFDHNSK